MSAKKLTITVPEELKKDLDELGDMINISRVCAEALQVKVKELKRLTVSPEAAQRWCLVSDGDHQYLCPLERRLEAVSMFEAIDKFYQQDDLPMGEVPSMPDFVIRLEGGVLTFENPLVNGQAP